MGRVQESAKAEVAEKGYEVEGPLTAVRLAQPNGAAPARIDEKGRLKLPSAYQGYVREAGGKVFVTSVDEVHIHLYPIVVWHEYLERMRQSPEVALEAATVKKVAQHYGDDSEMDAQGRVLIHTLLRRTLRMENAAVYLRCEGGRVTVMREEEYFAQLAAVQPKARAHAELLEQLGLC